jgi:hypothetical protein
VITAIGIYKDSKGPGICRSCKARIVWAETIQGKRMPFDSAPSVVSVHETHTGRVVEMIDTSISKSHFATCPQAKAWRRP